MGKGLLDRRMLPAVALIASLLVFLAALGFALRSPSPASRPTATVVAGGASPTGIAVALPTAAATATPASEPTPTAASTPTTVPTATRPIAATPSTIAGAATPSPTAPAVASVEPTPTEAAVQVPPIAPPVVQPAPTAVGAPTPTPTRAPNAPPAPPASSAPPVAAPPTATRPPAPPPVAGPPPSSVGVPVRLRIPSLGIDAAVEQVGVDADGNMATPNDPWNTAWYAPGIRPGQPGNAAIAGHVDYHNVGQVVFWDLNKLPAGAEVLVDTADGQTLRFVVRSATYFRPESAPLERIFGPAATPNLNLITCGGAFNPTTRQYDQRLVVFTTYVGR